MKQNSEYDDWGLPEDEAEARSAAHAGSGPGIRTASVSRRLIRWLIVSITVAMLGVALWVFSQHRTQNIISRNAFVKMELTEVGARFDGRIAAVEASPGTRVNAGQVIARLDDGHFRAQETEANATTAQLDRSRVPCTA